MQEFKYRYFQRDAINSMPPTDQAGGTITPPAVAQDDPVGVNDPVEAPRHYQGTGMEVWDVLKAFLSAEELIGYCRGNIIKYQLRYKQKGGLQDLRKADWYAGKLKRLVSGQP